MTTYLNYSATSADNNTAPPVGAPEGMYPSAVDDTMREMMSVVRQLGDQTQSTFTALGTMSQQNANAVNITGGTVGGSTTINTSGTVNAASVGVQHAYTTTLQIDPANSYEWTFYRDATSGDHFQVHRSGGWYDQWVSATGWRIWNGSVGSLMNLDPSGNLWARGGVTAGSFTGGEVTTNGDLRVIGNIHGGSTTTSMTIDNTNGVFIASTNGIFPGTGGVQWCGNNAYPWAEVVANVVSQLSDPMAKREIRALPDCTPLVSTIEPIRFHWRERDDGEHWGFRSDTIEQAMQVAGLEFAGCTRSEEGTAFLRPLELTAVLWKAVQELSARVVALEARTQNGTQ